MTTNQKVSLSHDINKSNRISQCSITLGGLKGANPAKGVAADDTLEARLEAQHDWFLENAGLEINI